MLKKYNWLWTIGNLFGLFSSCWYSLDVDDVAVICNNAVLLGWVPIVTNYLGLEKKKDSGYRIFSIKRPGVCFEFESEVYFAPAIF